MELVLLKGSGSGNNAAVHKRRGRGAHGSLSRMFARGKGQCALLGRERGRSNWEPREDLVRQLEDVIPRLSDGVILSLLTDALLCTSPHGDRVELQVKPKPLCPQGVPLHPEDLDERLWAGRRRGA